MEGAAVARVGTAPRIRRASRVLSARPRRLRNTTSSGVSSVGQEGTAAVRASARARRPRARRAGPAGSWLPCRARSPSPCAGRSRPAAGRSTRRRGARLRRAPRARARSRRSTARVTGSTSASETAVRRRSSSRAAASSMWGTRGRREAPFGARRLAAGVVFDHVVATEISQVGTNGSGLAGDRRAREAAGVEVRRDSGAARDDRCRSGSGSAAVAHSTNSSTSCAYASRVCGLPPVSDDANASVRQVVCLLTRAPFRAGRAARSRPGQVTAPCPTIRRSRLRDAVLPDRL